MATYITANASTRRLRAGVPERGHLRGDSIYVIDPELCTNAWAATIMKRVRLCRWSVAARPGHVEGEADLLERALHLHPDDDELKRRAADNEYPSRFRK